jgi:hypothetical protein
MKISMSYLIKAIRNLISIYEPIDHLLMYPDDFIEMMKNDDLRDETDIINPEYEIDYSTMSDKEILELPLCIFGIPIRTSEYAKPGKISRVVLIA